MRSFGIDLGWPDARQSQYCRNGQGNRDEEYGTARKQIPERAHYGRRYPAAERSETGVAAEPPANSRLTDEAKADCRNGRAKNATAGRVQGGGRQYDRQYRPSRVGQRAHANRGHGDARHKPFGSRPIDDCPAGHLAKQGNNAAHRQDETDLHLRPFLRCQVDRDERSETRLDVGEEEDKPIEASRAGARRIIDEQAARRYRCRTAGLGLPVADAVGAIDEARWLRKQVISPV